MRDFVYPAVIATARAWFKVGDIDMRMSGVENIPKTGGALLAINHLSFVDYVMAGYPGAERGRLTRFIAKKEIFDHPVGGPVMRSFHHIALDRGAGREGIAKAVQYLHDGELVGIFPEGTISQSFELQPLKTGAARIAAEAEAPLVPVVLWGTQRFLTKGKPRDFGRHKTVGITVGEALHPTMDDDLNAVTEDLEVRMKAMLDELIRSHPAEEQPPGSWWLPASYGGSAPTAEEAAAMYAEERRRRAEKKAAQRKSKKKK